MQFWRENRVAGTVPREGLGIWAGRVGGRGGRNEIHSRLPVRVWMGVNLAAGLFVPF